MQLRSIRACVGLALSLLTVDAAAQNARTKPPVVAGPKSLSDSLTGQAKADYEAGKLLFADGDFAGAAIKFKGAFDQSSDARLLWNIAACEKQERHYARAVALVKQYAQAPILTDTDRAEAKALLDAIEPFTVALTIRVNEAGAEIFVDDASVGKSPLTAPIVVDLGTRKIVVRKTGFIEATVTQALGGSKDASVDIALKPEVHEGEMTITSSPSAHIFLDSTEIGVGSVKRKVSSGGHTLRVVAEGMQPYQTELVVADDEKRTIDVPLSPVASATHVETPVAPTRRTDFRGVYARMTFPFTFGFGTGYSLPQGVPGTVKQDTIMFSETYKWNIGYSFDWFALEFVGSVIFTVRTRDIARDANGQELFEISDGTLGGFFGVGPRATSKAEHVRVTGGVALGAGPHAFIGSGGTPIKSIAGLQPSSQGNAECCQSGGNFSPGYTAFALAGDIGLLVGRTPGAKFFLAIDWYLEIPPDVVIGPDNTPGIPAQYFNADPQTQPRGWRILHGPQFFIGPSLGVQFGH